MQRGTVCLLVVILATGLSYAQPDTLFTMIIDNDGENEVCGGLAITNQCEIFVATNRREDARDTDMRMHLIGDSGAYYYSRWYNLEGHQLCFELVKAGNWFVMVGSQTTGNLTPEADAMWYWVDAEGDSISLDTLEGAEQDRMLAGVESNSGGVASAGYTTTYGSGGDDFYFILADGDQQGVYGGTDDERCEAIARVPGNGYMLAGWTESFASGSRDAWLVRIGENGDSLWSQTIGGGGSQRCNALVRDTATGDYILAGHSDFEFWLVRTDSLGNERWSNTYGGEQCWEMIQTRDGGFLMVGEAYNGGAAGHDGYIVRTDPQGGPLWTKSFDRNFFERFVAAGQTRDGGFIIAGETDAGDEEVWIVRLERDGPVLSITPISNEQVRLGWVAPVAGYYLLYSTTEPNQTTELGGADWYLETAVQIDRPVYYQWLDSRPVSEYRNYGVNFIADPLGVVDCTSE